MANIILNGERLGTFLDELSYAEIVTLANHKGEPTVTFRHADDPGEGILIPGLSVKVKDGTVINVAHTSGA